MAATSTLRVIRREMGRRYGHSKTITIASNSSTTFTLTTAGSPELRGPFTGLKIPVGSPVLTSVETTGVTGLGLRTFVSNWVPSTGVLTVSPAVSAETDITEIMLYDPAIMDPDRELEAINRALEYRLTRTQLWPLTFVPDGDMQGATVTDYWTAAASGTAAYASAQIYPAGSAADAVGMVGLNRVVQLTSTGATNVDGNGIRWPLSNTQRTWYFQTAIRLVSGTGTVTFSIRDNTNAADITLQVSRGNDTNTLTTTSLGDFMVCEGTFQMPATCAEIAPRLAVSATTMVAQMTPIIMFPVGVTSFPLPNRVEADDQVGNFRWSQSRFNPGTMADMRFSDPITVAGREHWLYDYGDHRTVGFNFPAHQPIWWEENVSYAPLSAMTDTTTAPLDHVTKWAAFELADQEMWSRLRQNNTSPDSELVTRNKKQVRNALLKQAQGSMYEPRMKHIVGRR